MTKYGRSPWIDRFPTSRIPSYPRHRGAAEGPVVIVGGGLTGCATAYAFSAAGVAVILVEAGRIGTGGSGASMGWMAGDPGVPFLDVEKALGRRLARHAFRAWRRAALDFASLLRRLTIRCALRSESTAVVAATPEQAGVLRRDQKARREAGFDVPLLNARTLGSELGIDATAAIREPSSAIVDPYRASLGLAAAAVARGARIFERSPVAKITFTRRAAEVFTAGGTIRTSRVVIATGVPTPLAASLARHFWFHTVFLALTEPVPARIRQRLGERSTVLRDLSRPAHIVRWVDDERLLVAGADADAVAPRHRERTTVQRTGQLMYELSTLYPDISGLRPAYGWDAAYARTRDGLPCIGPHRNFPHHLFAFGDSSHSVTGAYLASRILLRHHLEELDPADEPFAFTRYGR